MSEDASEQGDARNVYEETSSAEFVRERYAVQAIPTVETKGCAGVSIGRTGKLGKTYNLVLNWHNTEVDNLHSGPDHPVGLQCGNIDVLELALHSTLSTAFGHGHKGEETGETCDCQDRNSSLCDHALLPAGAKRN